GPAQGRSRARDPAGPDPLRRRRLGATRPDRTGIPGRTRGLTMSITTPTSIPGFVGELVRPGDDGYDRHRAVWNAMADRRPTLIARCTSADDVAAAARFGRAHDLAVGVRCGGHGILGFAVPEQGLMIDLTPMGEVRVDPDARRAHVGGGALRGTLDRATEPHGLATTAGNISHTGVGGLTLGGG